jgi:SAM-dependent methyltransferase
MNVIEYICHGLYHAKDPFYVKYLMGKRVLDIGSGTGEFIAREPDHFLGVDLDASLVLHCQKKGLSAYCMSAFRLEFADESFDAVHASQIIEHFHPADASRFLEEASRVTRPGGYIFLTTPGIRNVWNTFSHVRPYPPDSLRKLLESPTENYIRNSKINLVMSGAWGSRIYVKSRPLMFIYGLFDLLFPPSNPIGWTILLRKSQSNRSYTS